MNNTHDNGGTTIILANNTPQPVYGMNQPMAPYSQPMAVNPPVYQPAFQPQPVQPVMQSAYSQPFQASYGLGVQPQGQGPIIYWDQTQNDKVLLVSLIYEFIIHFSTPTLQEN